MGGSNSKKAKKSKKRGNPTPAVQPEASPQNSRECIVIMPDNTQIRKKAYAFQTAAEFKQECLGNNLQLNVNYDLILWIDADQEEIFMKDDDEFNEHLHSFDHLIIRERQHEAIGVSEINNVVKLK